MVLNHLLLIMRKKLFNCCFCRQTKRPLLALTDYKWLCQVDKSKGLDIGNTYQTEHAAHDFIGYIAKYET
jgi:hypothetical protein